jgi:DNA-binding NtrC family response regulator
VGRHALDFHTGKRAWLEAFQRPYLRAALDATDGTASGAARRAGPSRAHLDWTIEPLALR